HPRLAALLRETHGMMLYEEDLMASIAAMTGSSLEAADDMRAATVRADNAATLAGLERGRYRRIRPSRPESDRSRAYWRSPTIVGAGCYRC
ncbi:MAG: hypothetical protein ACREXW_20570, partial [Gammaproteobacteria bacterium]